MVKEARGPRGTCRPRFLLKQLLEVVSQAEAGTGADRGEHLEHDLALQAHRKTDPAILPGAR